MLYSRSLLAVCTCPSQTPYLFLPTPSFPPVYRFLPKSMSLFLFCKWIHLHHFFLKIPHIRDVIWYFSFSVWLTSLSITISRSIHVTANGISFFLMNEEYSIVYLYHIFFIHSSVDGHLSCFHVLATVNSAAMNTGLYVSFQTMLFFGYMPRSGIAGSCGSSFWFFQGISIVHSIVAVPLSIPSNSAGGSLLFIGIVIYWLPIFRTTFLSLFMMVSFWLKPGILRYYAVRLWILFRSPVLAGIMGWIVPPQVHVYLGP